jgi:hypothetical protein
MEVVDLCKVVGGDGGGEGRYDEGDDGNDDDDDDDNVFALATWSRATGPP